MVHFLKRVVPIILVAAVLIAAIVSPASAAPEKPASVPMLLSCVWASSDGLRLQTPSAKM